MRDGYTKKEYEACENYIRNVQKMMACLGNCNRMFDIHRYIPEITKDTEFRKAACLYEGDLVARLVHYISMICIRTDYLQEETRVRILSRDVQTAVRRLNVVRGYTIDAEEMCNINVGDYYKMLGLIGCDLYKSILEQKEVDLYRIHYSLDRTWLDASIEVGAVYGLSITLKEPKETLYRVTEEEWTESVKILRRYTAFYRSSLEQLPLQMEKYLRYLEVTDEKELSGRDKERKRRMLLALGREETACCQK